MAIKFPSPYLKSQEQLFEINWAKSNKWDVRFRENDMPDPFKSFFPAVSVVEPVFNLEDHSFNIGHASLDMIKGFKQPTLKIDFYDNHDCVLEKYFEAWVNNSILGDLRFVKPIESCLKTVEVYRYNDFGSKVWNTSYRVCPKGELVSDNKSDGEFRIFSVEFIIGSMTRS